MKTRTGFVSNSSSSSFIAYGANLQNDELIDLLILKMDETDLLALAECETVDDVHEKYSDGWDGETSDLFNKAKLGFFTEVPSEDGEHFIGISMDPEYELQLKHILNGIWSQDQLDDVDAFFKDTPHKAVLAAGYVYN